MPHGIVDSVREHAVRVNLGARRDPTIAAAATAGLERGVPLLDVDSRELLHQPGTDVRADLPVE